ncbi:unnamed protein product [Urochloa humidicola]
MSALRPAWGNPRGLVFKSVGDNIFIAEFGSKQDLERVLDGSPWNVSGKAVLVQRFDPNLRPTDVVFDKMPIWIRICDLPFGLMNRIWGTELAKKVGSVEKVDVDAQGRAWGPYLRAKVLIDISKPLLRCITIFSNKRQTIERYKVQYEKLPNYCYSCGIFGHSSGECPTLAERDEEGLLPYARNLRAPDDNKKKKGTDERQYPSLGRSFSSSEQRGFSDGCNASQSTDTRATTGGSSIARVRNKGGKEDEATPLLKWLGRHGKQKTMPDSKESSGKELAPILPKKQGTKRKQTNTPSCRLNDDPHLGQGVSLDAMELIVANTVVQAPPVSMTTIMGAEPEEPKDETANKFKKAGLPFKNNEGSDPLELAVMTNPSTNLSNNMVPYVEADIELQERIRDIAKRQRKEKNFNFTPSAVAGSQPRRSP